MVKEASKERMQRFSNLRQRFRRPSIRRRRKLSSTTPLELTSSKIGENHHHIELPLFAMIPESTWVNNILPFLDRWSQNHLIESSRYIPRHSFFGNKEQVSRLQWPAPGCIRVSRPIQSLSFSPPSTHDQHLMAAMAGSNQCLVYDKCLGPLKEESSPIEDIVLQLKQRKKADKVAAVQFSSDGNMMAIANQTDGTIRLYHVPSTAQQSYNCFRIIRSYQNRLKYIRWSPDSQRIVSWGDDGFLRVVRVEDGLMESTFWKTRLEVSRCSETVAFHPANSSTLAFAYNFDLVRLWNFETDQFRVLGGSGDSTRSYDGAFVTSVAYSPDGKYLAVGHPVSTIRLWTVTIPTSDDDDDGFFFHDYSRRMFLGPGWSAVKLLQFTSDSKYIACTGDGKQIRIACVATGTVVRTLDGHKARVQALCFSSDHQTLASAGCDRSIRLWNLPETRAVHRITTT